MPKRELTGTLDGKSISDVKIDGKLYPLSERARQWTKFLKVGLPCRYEFEKDNRTIRFISSRMDIQETASVMAKTALSDHDKLIMSQVAEKCATELACAIITASFKEGNPMQLKDIAIQLVAELAPKIEADMRKRY